jgi:hypothetical protein
VTPRCTIRGDLSMAKNFDSSALSQAGEGASHVNEGRGRHGEGEVGDWAWAGLQEAVNVIAARIAPKWNADG